MTTIGAHPARLDLSVYAGQPVDVLVPILDAAGLAVPANGWTGAAQVRATLDRDAVLLHTFTCAVADGAARITATAADTAEWLTDWPVRVAPWDVVVTDLGGIPHVLTAGWVRLAPRVTH